VVDVVVCMIREGIPQRPAAMNAGDVTIKAETQNQRQNIVVDTRRSITMKL
jgi:hypothetical protein